MMCKLSSFIEQKFEHTISAGVNNNAISYLRRHNPTEAVSHSHLPLKLQQLRTRVQQATFNINMYKMHDARSDKCIISCQNDSAQDIDSPKINKALMSQARSDRSHCSHQP
jgi:hypothetical protein